MRRLMLFGRVFVFVAAAACPAGGQAQPQVPGGGPERAGFTDRVDTLRYVQVWGRPVGIIKAWQSSAGEYLYDFQRSRTGLTVAHITTVKLDPSGYPSFVEITGEWERGVRFRERFSIQGDTAFHTYEEGGRPVATSAVAVPRPLYFQARMGNWIETALLAKKLLQSPEARVAMFPDGRIATIHPLHTIRIESGVQSTEVTLYLLPIPESGAAGYRFWLDENLNFFAAVGTEGIIREDFIESYASLAKAEETLAIPAMRATAQELGSRPAVGLAITSVNLVDVVELTVRPNTTVVVRGNRIEAVGPDGSVSIPTGAMILDGAGRSLIPGLWDMHGHLSHGVSDAQDRRLLATGVTSNRDPAGDTTTIRWRQQRIESGTQIGPRIHLVGLMDGREDAGPTEVLVSTEAEARSATRRFAQQGYGQVKIYGRMPEQLVPVVAEEARRLGLRLSGHLPLTMAPEEAVRAGFNEIHHVAQIFRKIRPWEVPPGESIHRVLGLHGAEVDLDSPDIARLIRTLKQADVAVDATLCVIESLFGISGGGGLSKSESEQERFRATWDTMKQFTVALHRAGVRILAGTDSACLLRRELAIYSEAGIPNIEVLRIATLQAAAAVGLEALLGSIAPGKLADMVLIDGNPVASIDDLSKVGLVIANGIVYEPARLREPRPWLLEETGRK